MNLEFNIDDFGITEDPARVEAARQYRAAAEADGWVIEPMYPDELCERSSISRKDGYQMHIISRDANEHGMMEASVAIYGPDGLWIKVPDTYDMEAISKGRFVCGQCHATDVQTMQWNGAGRICDACYNPRGKK